MNSNKAPYESEHNHFRIGLSVPIKLTALHAITSTIQAIWPEATLGTPRQGESVAFLIPKNALLDGGRTLPQDAIKAIQSNTRTSTDDIASQSDITIMTPDAVEITPPPETLNLLSGYCHALLESLPKGSNAVQQTIHIPDRPESYVLSVQPKSQAEHSSPVEWMEGKGWVAREGAEVVPSEGDRMRKKVLMRLSSMSNVTRVLNKTTRAQISEALKAD